MNRRARGPDDERERAAPRAGGGRVIRVGNYIIERRLGSGGQADVFLARDVVLRRLVALKVLHRTSAGHNVRVLDEARVVAGKLDHPNIVRVLHAELAEGVWYVAMEYVDGGNMELRVSRAGALEPARALAYGTVVADALAHAHELGVVHRDVKPQNLLETRAGVIKLADFGLADLSQQTLETSRSMRIVGTPQYLAPEVWLGEAATPRSDLYGLGATLFFMMTGRPPFTARNVRDLRAAHLGEPPVLPPDLPPAAAAIVARCMAKKPSDRPASARALVEELGDAVAALTGARRRKRASGSTEQAGFYSHSSRAAADAAVMRLPAFAAARQKLEEALSAAPPLVVFHGGHGGQPDALKAVQRAVVDVGGTRRFYVAARATLAGGAAPGHPPATLGSRLVEQLHLGQWPLPAWHDRVCAELTSEQGGGASLPSLMELEVRRSLSAAEATDLIELARRAEGKNIIFLVTCDGATAQGLLHEVDASGFAFLVRHVPMRDLSDEERAEHVRTWTATATGERLMWTEDALRLLRHTETSSRKPVSRLMHNAIMIAHGASMRTLTTWSVLGADAQGDYIQTVNDIPMMWRSKPAVWPGSDLLPLLIQLREGFPC
jgi:hypothetical protein